MPTGLTGIIEYPLDYDNRIERSILIFAKWSAFHEFIVAPAIYVSEAYSAFYSGGHPWSVGQSLTISARPLDLETEQHQQLLGTFNSLCVADEDKESFQYKDANNQLFVPEEGLLCIQFADKTSAISITYELPKFDDGRVIGLPYRYKGDNSIYTLGVDEVSGLASGHVEAKAVYQSRLNLAKLRADIAHDLLSDPEGSLMRMIKLREPDNVMYKVRRLSVPSIPNRSPSTTNPEPVPLKKCQIKCSNPRMVMECVESDPSSAKGPVIDPQPTVCNQHSGIFESNTFTVTDFELKLYNPPIKAPVP